MLAPQKNFNPIALVWTYKYSKLVLLLERVLNLAGSNHVQTRLEPAKQNQTPVLTQRSEMALQRRGPSD